MNEQKLAMPIVNFTFHLYSGLDPFVFNPCVKRYLLTNCVFGVVC